MYLVTQGKGRINQLGYIRKTQEYVYLHKGQEIWRQKGDARLFDYFNELRATHSCIDEEVVSKFEVFKRYEDSCDEFEKKERGF